VGEIWGKKDKCPTELFQAVTPWLQSRSWASPTCPSASESLQAFALSITCSVPVILGRGYSLYSVIGRYTHKSSTPTEPSRQAQGVWCPYLSAVFKGLLALVLEGQLECQPLWLSGEYRKQPLSAQLVAAIGDCWPKLSDLILQKKCQAWLSILNVGTLVNTCSKNFF
jgi:hypothetical protein